MTFMGSYAQRYDALYAAKDYQAECDLIERVFSKFDAAPATVLDIGCGTGGHVLELASRGYECTGVDMSPAMLEQAADKTTKLGLPKSPKWLTGNAKSFDIEQHFDAAIMMFAVVSYLTTNDDLMEALANIRAHLKPGSLFICDFWYGPAVLSVKPEDRVRVIETSDMTTIRRAITTLDSFEQTATVTFDLWSIHANGGLEKTTEAHKMRYFFPKEFELFLKLSGFSVLSMTEFPEISKDLGLDSWNALCVAVVN
jgi:SAM-dependent methyltransferase